jgi:hypothetical protein
MTDRKQQQIGIVALFSVAISVIGLTITLAMGIARIGAIYGTISSEHQQIFRELKHLADKKCP